MKKRTAIIFVALALGLAWAIRGHFGHEYGAAWAGAIAGMAVIVAAKRDDWTSRLPVLASLAAIGWGAGGMMSYGIVVGYGRGIDFGNVYYGLTMLAVIGGLYGFIGGGLFGLGLESTDERKPHWPALLTEMTVGGLLAWTLLIAQFEWKMTPPRSELWAACLGASVALAWFLYRNDYKRALRTAGYAGLGAGFGFGFGNFLQTCGHVSGLAFNWWNVMEFSLGFFGGLGMAYGVFTRDWPESVPAKSANGIGFLFLFLLLPVINIINAMSFDNFLAAATSIGIENGAEFAMRQIAISYIVAAMFSIVAFTLYRRSAQRERNSFYSSAMFFIYTLFYLVFSHIIKLVFVSSQPFQLNQALYWAVMIALFAIWFLNRSKEVQPFVASARETWPRWLLLVGILLALLAICAWISINIHDGIAGYHERF
jgi:hypothetical protein